jgi:DNA-binding transcriptional LysR family regulator
MFATHQLPAIMQKLRVTYPNAELTVTSATSQVLVDKMMHGEVDSAFVSLPVDNSNITTDLLFSDEIVAIAHPSIRSQRRNSLVRLRLPAKS